MVIMVKSNTNKPGSGTVVGQMRDEVVGELKKTAVDTGKQLVNEPKKILESILGGAPTKDDEDDLELGTSGSAGDDPQAAKTPQQQHLLVKKKQEAQVRQAKLLQLHRQRLQEAQQHFDMKKKQEEDQEEAEEKQEEEKKGQEVVQLSREQQKSEQLTRQLHGRQGSREMGKGKKF
jgi:hypothetical protein